MILYSYKYIDVIYIFMMNILEVCQTAGRKCKIFGIFIISVPEHASINMTVNLNRNDFSFLLH